MSSDDWEKEFDLDMTEDEIKDALEAPEPLVRDKILYCLCCVIKEHKTITEKFHCSKY